MLNTIVKQSRLSLTRTSFLICDVQDKFRPLIYRSETLIKKTSFLNTALNILDVPCFIAEQYPKALGRTVPDIVQYPTTKLFEKTTFSMLGNEDLRRQLIESGRNQVAQHQFNHCHLCYYHSVFEGHIMWYRSTCLCATICTGLIGCRI